MSIVTEIARKLSESVPVVWDRFTKTEDGFYVVYGWIPRKDGQRDFVLFELWVNDPDTLFWTTSSAKHSKRIMEVLYGSSEDHNDCRKIEELWQEEAPNKSQLEKKL